MRNLLPFTFWFWLYNQLFFFIGALGFFLIHFIVALLQLGGMDVLASSVLTLLYVCLLYKMFGRYLWRNRFNSLSAPPRVLTLAALLPAILGSIVLTACFAIAGGNIANTMTGMPVLAAINLSLSYLPLAKSVWTMLVLGFLFNLLTIFCFTRYCKAYAHCELSWLKILIPLAICFAACTAIIYGVTIMHLPAIK